ncbi:DeoR/GlpR family DNA-binding transcription regulator [Streptomyces sp. NPDC090025]|uniref:DeoR/GlpR family DNA-binding transcription regulator n=1 Tax=Streptomyces sp. NPDC090025 TaxID=3365922 RepID=UPI003839834E
MHKAGGRCGGDGVDTQERRRRVLGIIRGSGAVEVARLAEQFSVARETIRRDLRALERRGFVRRSRGGARPVESAGFETTLVERTTRNVPQKKRIAQAAVRLLGDAETVFVDEGFTPLLIAGAFPRDRPLTVVTASLAVAHALSDAERATVLLLGGRLRPGTLATVGPWTSRTLAGLVLDLCFVGANGISREHGLTTPDPAVAEVKRHAVRGSRRQVLVGAHTKFGVTGFCRFAEVRDVEAIVTDTGLSPTEAHRYSLLGPQVIRV